MTLHEPNTIHCVDCMDGLKEMPDNHVDLAIVDPPYGIKVGGSNLAEPTTYKTFDDSSIPSADYFRELQRVYQFTRQTALI
jgi:site-specific DNA-methyltransferase (adenine-specific)